MLEWASGLKNIKNLTIQRGKIVQMENIQLGNGEELKSLKLKQQYKFSGSGESLTTDKNQISTQKCIF